MFVMRNRTQSKCTRHQQQGDILQKLWNVLLVKYSALSVIWAEFRLNFDPLTPLSFNLYPIYSWVTIQHLFAVL